MHKQENTKINRYLPFLRLPKFQLKVNAEHNEIHIIITFVCFN